MLDAIKMLVDRWKDLDFRPKKEDDRCPKCGSDVKAFRDRSVTHTLTSGILKSKAPAFVSAGAVCNGGGILGFFCASHEMIECDHHLTQDVYLLL
jgi:hypothetical protein